ncbi:MAG: nickel pincer cofactor biosynthesis protein LarC [Lachnospiraceae bacterium]|nr:nickel pincer cofactor biosynthesis protein LarC [Lachnospiraceae bacterium]
MKILYLDCGMGAAGDMLTAALYELLSDEKKKTFIDLINNTGLQGVSVCPVNVKKCGITGTHMNVLVDGFEEHEHCHDKEHEHHDHMHDNGEHGHHDHSRSSMSRIREITEALDVPDKVREDALKVYEIIARAESAVHNTDISEIHFHEVGTKDAVVDVLSVCFLINEIKPERIIVSPVCTGSGTVKCAHGTLPVPAPATAFILRDIPMYQGDISSELCTPTGAALIKYFASDFSHMPVMKVSAIGYGMGTKDFETANCLRAFIGESDSDGGSSLPDEYVTVLSCNVDDMTGEEIGFAVERFLEEGAHDAFTVPVTMKKSRPGVMIEVICAKADTEKMTKLMFKHTSTIGIRQFEYKRNILKRHVRDTDTKEGKVRVKESEGYGVKRSKYEFEDLARIARLKGISIREAKELLQ